MANTPLNAIGRNIRRLRQKNRWSQATAAEKLDLSIPAFSKIELGITCCTFDRLEQIAELFSVPVMEIISEEGQALAEQQAEEIARLNEVVRAQELEIIRLQDRTISLYEELARDKV